VAKCIKYYSKSDIPLVAVPTTAGTGSEATHFAAIYKDGKKESVADKSILPEYAVLLPQLLESVPQYTKNSAYADALCQAIESLWSIKATDESRYWAIKAIELLKHGQGPETQPGSHYAGRAINISETTAPHAMSYMLTSLFGIAHGHAAALCLTSVWNYVLTDDDSFGCDIAEYLGYESPKEAITGLRKSFSELGLTLTKDITDRIDILTESVNTQRLANFPVKLTTEDIRAIYTEISK
jgi:alcohol dehydrogenase class IV